MTTQYRLLLRGVNDFANMIARAACVPGLRGMHGNFLRHNPTDLSLGGIGCVLTTDETAGGFPARAAHARSLREFP